MRCVNLDQLHLAVLDGLMHKVLTEIDLLGSLSSSNHLISPFDACGVVFIDRGVWVICPVVELQDTLFPQSESVKPLSPLSPCFL